VPKKNAATPKPEAKTTGLEPTHSLGAAAPHAHVVAGGLPRFNFNAPPVTTNEEVPVTDSPVRPSYESIQQEAKGPGVEEWRRIDKLRDELTNLYNSLREDARYTEEHKAQRAWEKYEETKAQVEKLAPEARQKMLRSAESLERLSIPTPEGEGLFTKDTNKLLLTAHERSRIEGLINRLERAGKGKLKVNPGHILEREYERGLNEGGPRGGATVRAVYELARDWGVDIHSVVDAHRKPRHHEALQNAQAHLMHSEMIGRAVPEPPFKKGMSVGLRANVGTHSGAPKASSRAKEGQRVFSKKRNRHW
jgi:hypothetical protein